LMAPTAISVLAGALDLALPQDISRSCARDRRLLGVIFACGRSAPGGSRCCHAWACGGRRGTGRSPTSPPVSVVFPSACQRCHPTFGKAATWHSWNPSPVHALGRRRGWCWSPPRFLDGSSPFARTLIRIASAVLRHGADLRHDHGRRSCRDRGAVTEADRTAWKPSLT